MKRIYCISTGVILIGLASCSPSGASKAPLQSVKIDTVKQAGEETLLQYPGRVKAAHDISLAFRVSGTIARFTAEEGAAVKKGQLLAEMDPTDYQVQLDATEAEYRQIKADAERVMALYADSATTASNYDKAVYGLQQISAKYRHHQDQLAYTRLYAPFDGYIQKCLFKAHETVGAGMPVISMVSGGRPEVEISLPAAEYIKRGQFGSFHCTFELYPGQEFALKPVSISPKANANQLYTMRLLVEPRDGQPLPSPGMNTTVSIHSTDSDRQQFTVPATALLSHDGATQLFVYTSDDSRVHLLSVEMVKPLSDGRIVVTSPRLEAGMCVVSSGVHFIADGEQVKPLAPPAATNVGGLL